MFEFRTVYISPGAILEEDMRRNAKDPENPILEERTAALSKVPERVSEFFTKLDQQGWEFVVRLDGNFCVFKRPLPETPPET